MGEILKAILLFLAWPLVVGVAGWIGYAINPGFGIAATLITLIAYPIWAMWLFRGGGNGEPYIRA